MCDAIDNYAMLAIQGPNARRIVGTLRIDLPKRMKVAARQIGRRPAIVCGTRYTGEDGVELLIDPEIARRSGPNSSIRASCPGLGARDTLRLEVCFHLPWQRPDHGNRSDLGRARMGLRRIDQFIGSRQGGGLPANGTDEKLAPS